nr:RecName: Full=Hemolymph 65 kDa lectin BG05 [Biomphalaria glabrata]
LEIADLAQYVVDLTAR